MRAPVSLREYFLLMTTSIRVADRLIGPGHPCFVVAEAGVNHNRDVELGKRLVDAALDVGADAVKFQTWVTEKLVARDAPTAPYQARTLGGEPSQFEMLKALELGYDAFRELKEYAEGRGILFFSTPDEEDSADFLDQLGVPLFKLSSAEIPSIPFLRHVARKDRPIILSTGMATLGEVEAAVRAIEEEGNRELILLQCVSAYPSDPADSNLRAMDTLASAFGYPVGFSDHTLGTEVAVAAVARGACLLEKHLTLDRGLPGPDHEASLDPEAFAAMVRAVRTVERALGDGVKRPVAAEAETAPVLRKSLVTARPLLAGEPIGSEDVSLRRTSNGLPPSALPQFLGRRLKRDLPENEPLTLDALE
jgi:N,N'-diacetyllegionaminate synthase